VVRTRQHRGAQFVDIIRIERVNLIGRPMKLQRQADLKIERADRRLVLRRVR